MGKFDGMLLLSDMDGTLLNDEHQISDENVVAIKYFTQNGGKFSIATGRAKRATQPYCERACINAPAVVFNGAALYDYKNDKVLGQTNMDIAAVDFVLELAEKFPFLGIEIFMAEEEYIAQLTPITEYHFKVVGLPVIVLPARDIPQPWIKLNMTAPEEQVRVVEKYVKNTYPHRYFYQRSGNNFFEAMSNGVDKGVGALKVCEACRIDRKNLFTIGDHMNDIELIEVAAISFAPSNAVEHIKSLADVVVCSNNEHCVASAINYLDNKFKQV